MGNGAWEIRQQNAVLTCILHGETTSIAWSLGFRNLILPGPVLPLTGMPFDHARNRAVMETLQGGFQYCFMLDSDTIPPRDAVPRLLAHNKPLISGLYCRRSPPQGLPVMIKGGGWYTAYTPGTVVDVDFVGSGCMLIHRSVLERLPPIDEKRGKHWFDWRVDMMHLLPQGDALSEDFAFCKQVREQLKIPILVDTSIVCRHVGFGEARPGQFIPAEATPHT